MADNIDKALNGLGLKTDSLPNDWMITLVNPKDGGPAQNMTVARFIELLTSTMSSLMGIDSLQRGMNHVFKVLSKGDSYVVGVVCGLCVIKHGWSHSEPSVVLVDPVHKTIKNISGRSYESLPASFDFTNNSPSELKITSTFDGNSGLGTTFSIAFQNIS